MVDDFAIERVLLAADLVPSGRVACYGDLGRVAGVGPRVVGAILRERGSEVAWWRIVNASGELPVHLLPEAREHWDAEEIAWSDGRVRLREFRFGLTALADAYAAASAG